MYINESQNEAPQIKRVKIEVNLRFKAKDGKFEAYNRDSREKFDLQEIEIVPISDSRFTVKEPQNQKGVSIWSSLYRSPKQTITVLQKKDGVNKVEIIASGTWQDIKGGGYKYTKILHCLINTKVGWKTCEFELGGISAIMWGTIRKVGTDGIVKLAVSTEKNYVTERGNFYQMVNSPVVAVSPELDEMARAFSVEITEMYKSYDDNYDHYKKLRGEQAGETENIPEETTYGAAKIPDTSEIKDNEVVGYKKPERGVNLDDEEDEVRLEDVPF